MLSRFLWTLLLLLVPLRGLAGSDVVLHDSDWTLILHPATLQVSAGAAKSHEALLISAGQPSPNRVSDLKVNGQRAVWQWPDQGVTVTAELADKTLNVTIVSRQAGEFTWPILPAEKSIQSYVLPTFEGVYAPAHDPSWSTFLAGRGGLSTTEDLSMPFWGVTTGNHTLTYLLTNPFNNELTFTDHHGNLGSSLTHHFTRNWTVKSYGLRISLGPASPLAPAKVYRNWLIHTGQFVTMREKIRKTPDAAKLLGAAHIYLWGDGISTQMLQTLHQRGFDRLWLGSPSWGPLKDNPKSIPLAKSLGYLIGPYDSYDSVHSPDAKPDDTWETAQFDQKLYDTGGIVLWDGHKKTGFEQKGYYLNEEAVWPYVQARVSHLQSLFDCNSWFIDCDAAGEFYDDFSPEHTANQLQEMQARLRRMAWIRDSQHVVIGSEGGAAYAASTIHFAHGMMTPVFGWGDPALKQKSSPYYLGAYYPDSGPAVFFKTVPLKPSYDRFYFDPRFRLPLYQTVFHDSLVTTEHWTEPLLKYQGLAPERSLLELLYGVPPLYHLNQKEFGQHGDWIQAEYAFFSPLHREIGLLPLADFAWLTPDRQVQRTRFGQALEMVANFGPHSYVYHGKTIPARSILAHHLSTGKTTLFTPREVEEPTPARSSPPFPKGKGEA